jgi:hypothetical protein
MVPFCMYDKSYCIKPRIRLWSSHILKRRILDATSSVTQACNWTVVAPALELLLHGLREHGAFDVRIGWGFGGEFTVKVCSVSLVDLMVSMLAILSCHYQREIVRTTDGLKVGSYFLSSNFRQSIEWKKWWALISAAPLAPSRFSALRSSRRASKSRAAGGTISGPGKCKGSVRILRYISFVFSS